MADRNFKRDIGTLDSGLVILHGTATFGASGAIVSQSCRGFSLATTDSEAGRYTVTLEDKYNELLNCMVSITGEDDTAFGAVGLFAALRNVDMDAKTFYIQLIELDGNLADTDPRSGDVMRVTIVLKNSSLDY